MPSGVGIRLGETAQHVFTRHYSYHPSPGTGRSHLPRPMPTPRVLPSLDRRVWFFAVGLAAWLLGPTLHAVPFARGDLKGSFDSTLSFGTLSRLGEPNPDYYGITNSFNGVLGHQTSVNTDDGNLNYGKGVVS